MRRLKTFLKTFAILFGAITVLNLLAGIFLKVVSKKTTF